MFNHKTNTDGIKYLDFKRVPLVLGMLVKTIIESKSGHHKSFTEEADAQISNWVMEDKKNVSFIVEFWNPNGADRFTGYLEGLYYNGKYMKSFVDSLWENSNNISLD